MVSTRLLAFLAVVTLYSTSCLGSFRIFDGPGPIGGGGGGGGGIGIGGGGRIWCTCRSWCRFSEFTISNSCRLPFFPRYYNTCCRSFPWWLTRSTGGGYGGTGGYPGYGGSGGYPVYGGKGGYPGIGGMGGYPGTGGSIVSPGYGGSIGGSGYPGWVGSGVPRG